MIEVWTTAAARKEIQKTVTRTKAFPRIWPLIGCITEFIAGAFAFLWLVAALVLGGAMLFLLSVIDLSLPGTIVRTAN
jgi:hypothetical protein